MNEEAEEARYEAERLKRKKFDGGLKCSVIDMPIKPKLRKKTKSVPKSMKKSRTRKYKTI